MAKRTNDHREIRMPNRSRFAGIACAVLAGVSLAALAAPSSAADYKMTVNRDRLLNAQNEPQNWLMMNGDYSSTRYSKLSQIRSEEHTSELQSRQYLVCRLLLEKKKGHSHRHDPRDDRVSAALQASRQTMP